ncbi:hypothetical protein [Lysobacter silvisoli]|uniref:Uncharacterized protein n=1 Tax=Lysobacter silvisoli TaxID=2293254 RepID=A0A371K452_9GAMM|nr:hypothetical protein [Lysobacter silvisoli]RDZ28668.1 hypothetical protein DX914_05950 [Lysobacter silvisoli]
MKAVAFLALLFAALPTHACSVREVLRPELLVEQAQAIYHVKADGYAFLPKRSRHEDATVRFGLLGVVKGSAPKAPLEFPGVLVKADDRNDHAVPYEFVRPAGRRGMCFAMEYRVGGEYLMLIKGGTPYWAALAPTNEQVFGSADAWLRWVKQQVAQAAELRPKHPSGS